jgi:hypothetical protein
MHSPRGLLGPLGTASISGYAVTVAFALALVLLNQI